MSFTISRRSENHFLYVLSTSFVSFKDCSLGRVVVIRLSCVLSLSDYHMFYRILCFIVIRLSYVLHKSAIKSSNIYDKLDELVFLLQISHFNTNMWFKYISRYGMVQEKRTISKYLVSIASNVFVSDVLSCYFIFFLNEFYASLVVCFIYIIVLPCVIPKNNTII
jgi:hypothetical protein